MLELIELSLFSIKRLLLNNEKIKKLLYNDSNNALNIELEESIKVDDYILLSPFYNLLKDNNYSKNSVISIKLKSINNDNEDNILFGSINISIVTNVDKWNLINNKIRPLEIANEIIKTINNKKFNVSNPLSFVSMNEIIYDEKIVGYDLIFNITDGKGEIDKY